jgi:hypothetical protein
MNKISTGIGTGRSKLHARNKYKNTPLPFSTAVLTSIRCFLFFFSSLLLASFLKTINPVIQVYEDAQNIT